MDVPPCIVPGTPLNWCAQQMFSWRVSGHGNLPGEWAGWRLAGRWLISPDGVRVLPGQMQAMVWHQVHMRKKRKKAVSQDAQLIALFSDLQDRIDRCKI